MATTHQQEPPNKGSSLKEWFNYWQDRTYEILDLYKEEIKIKIVSDPGIGVDELMSYVNDLVENKLPDEFDDSLFNFITDYEFCKYLEDNRLGTWHERSIYYILPST